MYKPASHFEWRNIIVQVIKEQWNNDQSPTRGLCLYLKQ